MQRPGDYLVAVALMKYVFYAFILLWLSWSGFPWIEVIIRTVVK